MRSQNAEMRFKELPTTALKPEDLKHSRMQLRRVGGKKRLKIVKVFFCMDGQSRSRLDGRRRTIALLCVTFISHPELWTRLIC